jgi:hypothetical protein
MANFESIEGDGEISCKKPSPFTYIKVTIISG